jgi:peptide/nickel transport system substrate-binding protein
MTLGACARCSSLRAPDAGQSIQPTASWLEGRPPDERNAPQRGGTLVVRAMMEPGGLNFLDNSFRDAWVSRITRNLVFETLLGVEPSDGSLKPQLATAWGASDDHRVLTLSLSSSATFSDGRPFGANDVVAVFDAIMAPSNRTEAIRAELFGLESWRALDGHTVELRWKTASPLALRALSRVPMYSANQLAGAWTSLAERPIGTGPFRIADWQRGQTLTLERRHGRDGRDDRAYLDRIVFRFVKDHTAAAGLFERGAFDLMTNIQTSLWRAMEAPTPEYDWAKADWQRLKSIDNSYSYIAWNEAHPAFADARVRTALAKLYDSALVARLVDFDLEPPTTCPYYAPSDSCDPLVTPIRFSPMEAARDLAAAGFEDHDGDGILDRAGIPFRFTFLLPASSVRLGRLVPLLHEQLTALGIDMKIEKVDTATLSARLARRDFDAVSRVWTEFDREHDIFPIFHSSQSDGGSNFIGFSNEKVDRLLESLQNEFDPVRRRALEREAHRAIFAAQPYLFMTVRPSLDAAKRSVHGLKPAVTWYDLREVWVSH